MDIINPSFLSALFNNKRKKIYSNLNQNESKESSKEKTKRKEKRKEVDLIQLFQDSDDIEDISQSFAKKIKAEEAEQFSKMDYKITISERKFRNYKKRRSSKKRNNSS